MRNALLTLAFLCGGVSGGAGCAALVAFGMFYGLRLVCWIAKSDNYMFYMWFAILFIPLAGLAGFVFGGYFAVDLLKKRLDPQSGRGFDAIPHSAEGDAG